MKKPRISLAICLILVLLVVPVTADNTMLRPKATATIQPLDESVYDILLGALGGEEQLNETTEGVDWLEIKEAVERPYTDAIGPLFYAIVFALPFLMQWLRQGNMAIPGAIGTILGGFMLAQTPAEYHLVAVTFIALGILAVVWGIVKDRV